MNRIATIGLVVALFAFMGAPTVSAQLAIDNGTITTTVFGGNIGGDCSGSHPGFTYNGVGGGGTVLCAIGLLVGTNPNNVIGDDYADVAGVSWSNASFSATSSPYAELEQGFAGSFSDTEGAGIDVDMRVFYSDDDDSFEDFFVAEYVITNNSGGTLDLAPGLFVDWDLDPFATNNGAFSVADNAAWVWDPTFITTPYFGVALLDGSITGGACMYPYPPVVESDMYNALIGPTPTDCTAQEDIRHPIGADGVTTVANGGSFTMTWAFIAGDNEADFLANVAAVQAVVPVEMVSFNAILDGGDVTLTWSTASETNNAGFEVQVSDGTGYTSLGFVEGHGTTVEAQTYTYSVGEMTPNTYQFRLKQIDFDGAFEYSGEIEVTVETPGSYVLLPAYPNPFNPTATVRFAVSNAVPVSVTLHDALGRTVSTLYEGVPSPDATVSLALDGTDLPSGLYLVRLSGPNFSESQQVTLLK